MKYATIGITTIALVLASSISAQVQIPADQATTIESGGPGGTDFYAQFSGGGFDEYSLAEFNISKADFGGSTVTALNSVTLRLTVNDRFFSATGPFSIFFTTDSVADLSTTSNYDALTFTPAESFGIDTSVYTYAPVSVGTGTYDESLVPGGSTLDVAIDLATVGPDLLTAINDGDSVHFLLGVPSPGGAVATFSGVGNTFDPGDPTLIIDATTSGPVPEPSDYPTAFTATPEFRTVELTWTDSADTAGYLVAISDDSTITAPIDGVEPIDDLDLSDGEGAIVVPQGVEAAEFLGLAENTQYYFSIFPYSNTGTDTDYKTDNTAPTSTATTTETPSGVIITQYYEGSSGNNKYIELSNTTASPVDMSSYILTSWSNAATEDWKNSGNTTSRTTEFVGITLLPGASIVVANPDSVTPLDASDADVSTGEATFFSGDDSVVLYASATQDPSNIVDAIPFTDVGNEGANTSFLRISTVPGYDLVAGTSVIDFPTVWSEIPLTTVDSAVFGDDAFLGSSSLVTAPPQIFFTASSAVVGEGVGTIDLTVEIQNPDGNSVSASIVFDAGDGIADTSDIGGYTTQTINFGPGAVAGDQQTVTVTITDDALEESTEDAVFRLENLVTTGNAFIANPSATTISIQDNDTPIPNVFISEIVDPSDDGNNGRYVELYNPTAEAIDLAAGQWNLIIYFNANTSGTDIPLTGTIPAGGTYIVANDATFGTVYSTTPADVQNGTLNSNGDDNFELRFGGGQTTGVLVDVYGQPGTQGNEGAPWNFADSRAVRLDTVTSGATTWDAAEWAILPAAVADATPRVHPETIIIQPSGVSATAISASEIEIAFTPASGNDVVVVFNTTGSFTAPTGLPLAGQPLAGGTVLAEAATSPLIHNGLSEATQYFYAVFSYDGAEYSNAVFVDATTPIAGLINSETFDAPAWFNATVSGDDPWSFTFDDAFIDGALTIGDPVEIDNHYLVSPALDFSAADGIELSFDYAGSFDVTGLESLELVYSTDYSGDVSTATWVPISFNFTNTTADLVDVTAPDDFVNSGAISMPASLEEETGVRLAFRYTNVDGELINSEQWVIDNIVVQGSGGTPPANPLDDYLTSRGLAPGDLDNDTNGNGFTVIEEYFAGFADASGTDTIIYGFDPAGPALTLTSDLETDPDGVVVDLLATSDLSVAFTSVPFSVSSVDNGDGTFTRSYTETTPPAGADSRFYQLQLSTATVD